MRFGWVTINVQNLQASQDFYTGVIGMHVKRRMQPKPGTDIIFLGFSDSETEIELIHNAQHQAPQYGQDLSLGFAVASVDEHMDLLRANGLTWTGPF